MWIILVHAFMLRLPTEICFTTVLVKADKEEMLILGKILHLSHSLTGIFVTYGSNKIGAHKIWNIQYTRNAKKEKYKKQSKYRQTQN